MLELDCTMHLSLLPKNRFLKVIREMSFIRVQ